MLPFTTATIGEFKIIGISVRTTNSGGQASKDIGNLWAKFIGENLAGRIPNKEINDIYCIYTDYETDFKGAYTTILGCRVTSTGDIPDGFISKTIPETKYQIYKSTGRLPDCVVATWTAIWQSDINRKYIADFDVYGQKAQNLEIAEVETYVSTW